MVRRFISALMVRLPTASSDSFVIWHPSLGIRVQNAGFQQLVFQNQNLVLRANAEAEDALVGFLKAQQAVLSLRKSTAAAAGRSGSVRTLKGTRPDHRSNPLHDRPLPCRHPRGEIRPSRALKSSRGRRNAHSRFPSCGSDVCLDRLLLSLGLSEMGRATLSQSA